MEKRYEFTVRQVNNYLTQDGRRITHIITSPCPAWTVETFAKSILCPSTVEEENWLTSNDESIKRKSCYTFRKELDGVYTYSVFIPNDKEDNHDSKTRRNEF